MNLQAPRATRGIKNRRVALLREIEQRHPQPQQQRRPGNDGGKRLAETLAIKNWCSVLGQQLGAGLLYVLHFLSADTRLENLGLYLHCVALETFSYFATRWTGSARAEHDHLSTPAPSPDFGPLVDGHGEPWRRREAPLRRPDPSTNHA